MRTLLSLLLTSAGAWALLNGADGLLVLVVGVTALVTALVGGWRRLEGHLEVEPDGYVGLPRSYPEYVEQLYGGRVR